MDASEQLVREYLEGLGYHDIVYEPDGQMPPDFAVDGRIAVEVRRLDQNEQLTEGRRSLEAVSRPLRRIIEEAFAESGPPTGATSWFVAYTFARPLPPWPEIKAALRNTLDTLKREPDLQNRRVTVAKNLQLRFARATEVHPTHFVFGMCTDRDSGGFVVAEMARNLKLCIEEKTAKVAPLFDRYAEWWLALVDRISFGPLSKDDAGQLASLVPAREGWRRIIILNPLNPKQGLQL